MTSSYAEKTAEIEKRHAALNQEKEKLLAKRREEVLKLIERYGFITQSDQFVMGLLVTAKEALLSNSEQVKAWEKRGREEIEQQQKPNRRKSATAQNSKAPTKPKSHLKETPQGAPEGNPS